MYEKVQTKDGSVTYRRTDLDVTYRSVHGAQSESQHVFLGGTKLASRPTPWRVLELGFGTGLNFQQTCRLAEKMGVELEYYSLEPSPMPTDLWLVDLKWKSAPLDQPFKIGKVTLHLVNKLWQDYKPPEEHFGAFYHDPFGPGQAPDCWERPCFEWSHQALTEDGVLATFGASTKARQAMKEAGYLIGSLPGAGGKREMTVASKSAEALEHAKTWKRL